MIESKFYKENKTSNNFFKKIILRILVTTIIALILLISFKMNSSFKKTFYHYVYEEHKGIHGWDYWDEHITDFLEFLQLDAPERAIAN